VIERAVAEQGILSGTLTPGTDNGSAFTARATRLVTLTLGVAHRGGYRDPRESDVHRVMVSLSEGALRLAPRARDPRASQGGDRRLHPPLPRPAPQPAELQDTPRGQSHVGRCTRSTTKHRGRNSQQQRVALQTQPATENSHPHQQNRPRPTPRRSRQLAPPNNQSRTRTTREPLDSPAAFVRDAFSCPSRSCSQRTSCGRPFRT
jgi:hypothetical protein